MSYIVNMVIPVPKKNLAAYRQLARRMGKVMRDHGALEYTEYLADDVKPGKVTSFPQAVKLKPGEVVVVARIVYKSRAHHDRVFKKAMADPRAQMDPKQLPFDGMRVFWGGFKPMISL